MHLEEPTSGRGRLLGEDLFGVKGAELRELRRNVQMVFQDPFGSLNPRRTVGQLVMEPWQVHRGIVPPDEQRDRAAALFEKVGLKPDHIDRYPDAFSGGQRQRVGVARALALSPSLLICDEPVSALDVSIQAQVLNLLADVQQEFGLSYLFISHDLSVVRHLADRVAVLYLGRLVEIGSHQAVYERPAHPYTRALLSAVPSMDLERRGRRETIRVTNTDRGAAHDRGCVFRSRCWKADPRCETETPPLARQRDGQWAACHYPES
jgi:oligopeptide transport system ATP-binding protein